MLKKIFAIFLICSLIFSKSVFALPQPSGYVNDNENIVENVNELEAKISNFEEQTGIEIAVLTTPDFGDTYLEDYAVKVFEEWGIGKEGEDNGVLILVSKEQRQSRIEVGYGLEGVLTDGVTGRIQDVAMIPNFQEENYSKGINEGVALTIEILGGEEIDGVTTNVPEENEDVESLGCLGMFLLGFLLLVPNPFVGALIGGVLGFLIGMIFLGPMGGLLGAGIGAIVGFLIGLIAKAIPAPVRHGIAYSMMSGGRRGSSGGGSSFGGFGGGMSGGGGSSRSW